MGLYSEVIAPALTVLARMEARGIPLDVEMRNRLRKEAKFRLIEVQAMIWGLASKYHRVRRERVQKAADCLETERALLKRDDPERKEMTKRLAKARLRLKQIGEQFVVSNDNHWRTLLYDKEVGLGLTPTHTTDSGEPSVDKDAIRALQLKHPEVELLGLRVESQDLGIRLRNRLAIEPDRRGRVHFAYSLHKTARIASGSDDEEEDKERASEGGNGQNVTDRDRRMFRAEPGKVFVQADWSQAEARVFAWFAREFKMLDAWYNKGLDIHCVNGQAIARALGVELSLEETRTTPFPHYHDGQSYRQAGKLTHKLHYGMKEKHFSDTYGIPIEVCAKIIQEYFDSWPRLREFQQEEIERATRDRKLVNPFGRVHWFHRFVKRKGQWVIEDQKEALASRPQGTVGDMCKAVLPELEKETQALGAELLTTTHDSFLFHVEELRAPRLIEATRSILEQEWSQLGELPGFGLFRCPADFAQGRNWGKWKKDNLEGLKEVK